MNTSIRTRVTVPLAVGMSEIISFNNLEEGKEHVAVALGDWENQEAPIVRLHSECLTGDVFASLRCDCGKQLEESLNRCNLEGGIILYLRQEGRGIGLYNKLEAYALQNQGMDTYEANRALNHPDDARDFKVAADMLKAMGITKVRLHSNNPKKAKELEKYGITVTEIIPTGVYINPHNERYLSTKRGHGGHNMAETAFLKKAS